MSNCERIRTEIVNQHATCLAVNPIQGCPKQCKYCFLNHRNQTLVKPDIILSPQLTLKQLLLSKYYTPDVVLSLYTWTDAFATRANREHFFSLLDLMATEKLTNAITIITKCFISDEAIEIIKKVINSGLRVIVYLSYSGLDATIERGINHERLKSNFQRLNENQIPIIHYWRPALPENSTFEILEGVLELAAKYSHCSVVAGLKVEKEATEGLIQLWPELKNHSDLDKYEGVISQSFVNFISNPPEKYIKHPIYYSNSCALSFVLKTTEKSGTYGTSRCINQNRCAKRDICENEFSSLPPLDVVQIKDKLVDLGYNIKQSEITIPNGNRDVYLEIPLSISEISHLSQIFTAKIKVKKVINENYWSTGIANSSLLII